MGFILLFVWMLLAAGLVAAGIYFERDGLIAAALIMVLAVAMVDDVLW